MVNWFIVCIFGLVGAKDNVVLNIGENAYTLQRFYDYYPKKQWENADSIKRVEVFNDFIKRQLCIIEAKRLGLESDPSIAVKVRERSRQILVNESYDNLVALPLISQEDLLEARTYAREEILLHHILIGHSGAYLARPPDRSVDDALVLAQDIMKQFNGGMGFADLAEKYSDDPGAERNGGALGWVPWGATVPSFQSAAFRLETGVLSDPVLTDFGYHLILIGDRRLSDFQYMSEDEYELAIINLSKGTVKDRLRGAAVAYDSLQIEEHGVHFNSHAIIKISEAYALKQKEGSFGGGNKFNVADFLDSMMGVGVVCVYDGKGFGLRWFANKIRRIPVQRQPALNVSDKIISVFKTIILQDIALNNGYLLNINNSYSYKKRKADMVSGLLYDAYLKLLVNSVPGPDTSDIRQYYNNNMGEKYAAPGKVLIREIRVSSRRLADSLLILINAGADFSLLADEYSLINQGAGGLGEPFLRKKRRAIFDAAILLDPGKTSPVLAVEGGIFSIIMLVEKIPGAPLEFLRVYSRIESLLIKECQNTTKKDGIDGLLDKYDVHRHFEVLGR